MTGRADSENTLVLPVRTPHQAACVPEEKECMELQTAAPSTEVDFCKVDFIIWEAASISAVASKLF